jgi:hypothetical protein
MKNIAFDDGGAAQLDAICVNGAFDRSADCQLLGDEVAFHLCTFVNQNDQRPKLALDLAEYMHRTLVNNLADHSHAASDGGYPIG